MPRKNRESYGEGGSSGDVYRGYRETDGASKATGPATSDGIFRAQTPRRSLQG